MKPPLVPGGDARRPPGPLARVATLAVAAARTVGASRYGALAGRVVLVGAGLLLLAVIGRSALAGAGASAASSPPASAPMSSTPAALTDAGSAGAPPPPPAASDGSQPEATPNGDRVATPATLHAAHGPATPDDPVILNQANVDDLVRLPGVGQKRAIGILAARTRLGRFRQVEDLLKVKGIGRATLRRLRPLVRLDAPPPVDAGST